MTLIPDPALTFYHILTYVHITVGSLALVLFWLPMMVKKGGPAHTRFGRYYTFSMYLIATSGAIMASMVLISPEYFKAGFYKPESDPEQVTASIRLFWSFLLFLCLLIVTNIRHAIRVLEVRQHVSALRKSGHILWPVSLLVASIAMLVIGWMNAKVLLMIFGGLGAFVASGNIRYCLQKAAKPHQWLAQHIGSICGSGVGVYTAFFAFGGRKLFSGLGDLQLLFWILPGVLGTLLIAWATRKYARRPA